MVRFIQDRDEWMATGRKLEHVGYMRAHFRTKKDAASYYHRHNPRMRGLNAHNTWKSDWDPTTLKYTRLNLFIPFKINPFWLTILRFVSARCRLPF